MTDATTTQWQAVWRKAIGPRLSVEQLTALRDALVTDDVRLIQGVTTTPPPLPSVRGLPVEAACALGFCAVIAQGGFGEVTVEATQRGFDRLCYEVDNEMGEPAVAR